MADTSVRTLRLLSLLQNHRYWRGAELADRLAVSERTLRRDVDRLRELGYPVESQRGLAGGYQLAAGAALPPLIVDDDEAVALVVGLQSAAQSAVAGVAEASVRALAKVVQVLPPRLRRRAEALGAMTVPAAWGADASSVDTEVLTTLAQAARSTERVEFDYTDRAAAASERLVEPHRLVVLGRRWYLVAYDMTRFDWRTFRLDRIRAPRPTGARFPDRELPATDAAEYVRSSIGSISPTHTIEAIVESPAERVHPRIGRWGTVTEVDDRTCRVEISADSLAWPIMALGSLDAEFTVVEPATLVEELDAWSTRFARAVAASGVAP
jgi:predicted DNA-binding transcriptional regulator YafY